MNGVFYHNALFYNRLYKNRRPAPDGPERFARSKIQEFFITPNRRSSGKTFARRAKADAGRISFPLAILFCNFTSATKEIH
jgi:hypothetical protein